MAAGRPDAGDGSPSRTATARPRAAQRTRPWTASPRPPSRSRATTSPTSAPSSSKSGVPLSPGRIVASMRQRAGNRASRRMVRPCQTARGAGRVGQRTSGESGRVGTYAKRKSSGPPGRPMWRMRASRGSEPAQWAAVTRILRPTSPAPHERRMVISRGPGPGTTVQPTSRPSNRSAHGMPPLTGRSGLAGPSRPPPAFGIPLMRPSPGSVPPLPGDGRARIHPRHHGRVSILPAGTVRGRACSRVLPERSRARRSGPVSRWRPAFRRERGMRPAPHRRARWKRREAGRHSG